LIDRFKKEKNELLISSKEWFQIRRKEYIVLDDSILDYDVFYELLDVTLPSETILENAEKILGTYVSPDQIRESILKLDGEKIVLYYLRWGWFREYATPFLPEIKKRINLRPLNYCFSYDPVTRNPVIREKSNFVEITDVPRRDFVTRSDGFVEWFFSNFYVGYPNKWCDINRFIVCASSYYDFDALERWNVSTNETAMCELGAIHEAAKKGTIWQVEDPSDQFLECLREALDSLLFPKELRIKLRETFF
jgi:hypothetical protein